MEQKENLAQHGGESFASLRRLRAQGKRLSGAETHSSNEGFQWNEATSNYIHENDGEVTLHEESSPVQKKLFARKRFPLVPIVEDSNVIPESSERVGILDTQSTKKQCPSESRLRIRRALHRRSCVPAFRNTESLSPNKADDSAFKDSKVKKTITGISPAAYSSWEIQDGGSAREPQESFAQSLGITGESRLAGRGRRRSKLLSQEEGLQTKTGVKEEYCHQSVTKKQDETIAENEETTNWGSQLLIQTRKEASNSGIPGSDVDVTLNEENSSVQKKLFARKRFPHVLIVEDSNAIPESGERVGILDTKSTKKQCPSESRLHIRRALHRRSCVPAFMNAESLSPNTSNDSAFKDSKVKKTITGISPAAYSSGMIQDGGNARKPQESFAQSLGITGESRLAGRGRRRSQLLWQVEGSQTKTGVEEEYCHQSVTKKQDEMIAENAETANWGSILQSRSKEESKLRIRRALQRRSCVPSFRNTESLSQKKADDSAFKDSRVEKTIMGISPAAYSSGEIQDGSSARKPQESFAQSLGITGGSRLAGKGRRRSQLLWQEEGSQTKTGVEEYCHQSVTKMQDKTTGENEETANWGSQLHIQSRSKEDNQQEAACGNKTKSETHVLGAERGGRATVRNNSVKRRQLNQWAPYGGFGRNVKQTDVLVADTAGQESQECRRMLQFESDNMSDVGKEITSPLIMMTQTPIISRASVLQNPVGQNQLKEVCEPMIKKSLLDHTMKTSRFKRRWSTRLHPHPDNTSGESQQNKKQNISGFGNKCENSLDESLVGCKKEPRRKDLNHAPGDTASKLCRAVKESNPDVCTTTNSVRQSKFPQYPESTKKIQRRRSVAVLGLRTPLRRKSTNFKVKSISKLKDSTISSKIPEPEESKNCAELNKSLASTSNSSLHAQISDIVLPDSEAQEENNLSQKNVPKDVSLKADVSTNTSFNFVIGKHEDMNILNDIDNLLKEQEEINIKASLLQKKIEARRLDMKEKKVMESFMTSVSPLKRLRAMISKTIVDDGSGLQNPQPCMTEGEGDAQGPHAIDQSEVDWKSPKIAPAITDSQTHWRRQQNKRLVRTFEESTPDNENFLDPCQGSSSPFTTLVGDCERPSLAPMTPHSRLQVSQLKKSLRKQLEQLYD